MHSAQIEILNEITYFLIIDKIEIEIFSFFIFQKCSNLTILFTHLSNPSCEVELPGTFHDLRE